MRCSCAMMSHRITSPEEEEGADGDGAAQDGVEWEGGVAKSDYQDLNCASLRLTIA